MGVVPDGGSMGLRIDQDEYAVAYLSNRSMSMNIDVPQFAPCGETSSQMLPLDLVDQSVEAQIGYFDFDQPTPFIMDAGVQHTPPSALSILNDMTTPITLNNTSVSTTSSDLL